MLDMNMHRTVLQHPTTKRWAFVELSEINPSHSVVLGDRDFETENEAYEFSKGFTSDSYTWEDPKVVTLINIAESIESNIVYIQQQLSYLRQHIKNLRTP
jgi:hypothetical protein